MTRWDGVMVGREALSVEAGILEVAYDLTLWALSWELLLLSIWKTIHFT